MVGLLKAIMDLECAADENVHLPVSGGQYFLTGRASVHQNVCNNLHVQWGLSPGAFMLVSEFKAVFFIYVQRRSGMCSSQWLREETSRGCFA